MDVCACLQRERLGPIDYKVGSGTIESHCRACRWNDLAGAQYPGVITVSRPAFRINESNLAKLSRRQTELTVPKTNLIPPVATG